ncbi:MAG: DUF4190 domain-containing protein [Anaerolineaceae bacterium]|nr:DUF4190 domain-containing protein [Anaerolineaceae bacterium]
MNTSQSTKRSGLAIASFVLGVAGLLASLVYLELGFMFGIVGGAFGIAALVTVKREGSRGAGFATAGLIFCLLTVTAYLFFVLWLLIRLFTV